MTYLSLEQHQESSPIKAMEFAPSSIPLGAPGGCCPPCPALLSSPPVPGVVDHHSTPRQVGRPVLGVEQVLVVAGSHGGGREGLAVPLQQGAQGGHPGVGEGTLGGGLHLVGGGLGTVGGGVAAVLLTP